MVVASGCEWRDRGLAEDALANWTTGSIHRRRHRVVPPVWLRDSRERYVSSPVVILRAKRVRQPATNRQVVREGAGARGAMKVLFGVGLVPEGSEKCCETCGWLGRGLRYECVVHGKTIASDPENGPGPTRLRCWEWSWDGRGVEPG